VLQQFFQLKKLNYFSLLQVEENKSVFLHRAKTENIEFYEKTGFAYYGTWAEYSIKD
jgi:hypothetical protein